MGLGSVIRERVNSSQKERHESSGIPTMSQLRIDLQNLCRCAAEHTQYAPSLGNVYWEAIFPGNTENTFSLMATDRPCGFSQLETAHVAKNEKPRIIRSLTITCNDSGIPITVLYKEGTCQREFSLQDPKLLSYRSELLQQLQRFGIYQKISQSR